MKFDKGLNIVIKCDNAAQVEKIFELFVSDGFCDDDWSQQDQKSIRESNLIRVDCNSVFTMDWEPSNFNEELTYQQFMEKYGMSDLKSKIEEAKNKTHMSLHQMSKAIGFNEHYLSAVVKRNRSIETQKKVIALLDDLIQKSHQELTHDFQGKALNTQVEDAMMIPKTEYSEMYSKNTALCFKVGTLEKENANLTESNANLFNENSIKDFQINQLKKELDHKTQVAEKHADMRNKAELHVSELEKIVELRDKTISQLILNSGNQVYKINELENKVKSLQKDCLNLTSDNDDLEEKYGIILKKYEKKFEDFWTVSRENIELENSKRCISIWLAVSILIIVVILAFGVLHFNGVV